MTFVSLFEFVQFLDHRDGDIDIIVLELVNTPAVMKNHIGVQNKDLFHSRLRINKLNTAIHVEPPV